MEDQIDEELLIKLREQASTVQIVARQRYTISQAKHFARDAESKKFLLSAERHGSKTVLVAHGVMTWKQFSRDTRAALNIPDDFNGQVVEYCTIFWPENFNIHKQKNEVKFDETESE